MEAHGLAHPTVEPAAAAQSHPARLGALRRVLDLAIALAVLLLATPLLLLAALAIRLDSPGPVIFRQRRLGRDRSPFTVFKLRTMRAGANSAPHRDYVAGLIAGTPAPSSGPGLYKLAVDDRITRVGRVLRKLSIDELPQLANVLRGEMSLVGPRPVTAYEAELYPDWYEPRFEVKPGLTGLWQVSGRSERTYEEMVRLDIEYASASSLWLDLRILARTVWVVALRRGAA